MTLLAITGRGRHRAADAVTALRAENTALLRQLDGAARVVPGLEQQLATVRTARAEAEQVVVCLDADLTEVTAQRDAAVDEANALRAQLAAARGGTEADTQPIPTIAPAASLLERFATGDVLALHNAPHAGRTGGER